MKSSMPMGVVGILALAALSCHSEASSVSPVQKVLTMMTEMQAKGELMLKQEAKTFATYSEWVSDQSTQLGFEIKTSKSDIEKLLAEIGKADSDVDKLSSSIAGLEDEIGTAEKEKATATEIRDKEHAEYVELSTDYSESVEALEKAIQTMESKNYDVPQAMALMQKLAVAKTGMRRVLAAFLQEKEESSRGGPEVAAYEFQSGGIIQLLEKFLKKFQGELADVESAESNQAHNYDMEMIHLSDTIAYLKKELEEKSVLKAKRSSDSAAAKGDLASTKNELAEDETTLKDMKATFAAKSDTFKANQEVRKQELEAIGKAIEIISSPDVADGYGKHLGLVQSGKVAFLQMRSVRSRVGARQRVTEFLNKKAKLLSSQSLQHLVQQMASNPFDKVVQMIKDLLEKLKEEAAAEAEHKAWCDEQLKKNKMKVDKKTTEVNKLTATVEALTETIASMGEKIATLSKEQAELTKAMSEATGQRTKEKATNTETIKDATAGEEATKQALVILKEFYASQASFLQQKGNQVPEMAAYKGMQSGKGGVVGMLEVITSDFARLTADTKAAENSAASEYAGFMKDAKASKKAKHDLEFKTSLQKDQKEFEKAQTEKDLTATQEELDRALDYKAHLKPVCLEVHVSYEERTARRKEEIEALKEAYKILDQK
jgi:hypothetical protein